MALQPAFNPGAAGGWAGRNFRIHQQRVALTWAGIAEGEMDVREALRQVRGPAEGYGPGLCAPPPLGTASGPSIIPMNLWHLAT